MENIYHSFAQVYDLFMDNIPYDDWSAYLISLLQEYQCQDGLILDLGCGTGNITQRLQQAGYDMIGIDNSMDMLLIAMEKQQNFKNQSDSQQKQASDILYLLQDMREFELYGTVSAVVSICDSLNYILDIDDLIQVFKLVNNYLDPKGIFIFDCNTVYKFEEIIGEQTIAENRPESSFIWENEYQSENHINIYDLTLYIRENDGRYSRYEETHYERAYTLEEFQYALFQAGMEYITAYDALTHNAPHAESERLYIIARENGKSIRYQ